MLMPLTNANIIDSPAVWTRADLFLGSSPFDIDIRIRDIDIFYNTVTKWERNFRELNRKLSYEMTESLIKWKCFVCCV